MGTDGSDSDPSFFILPFSLLHSGGNSLENPPGGAAELELLLWCYCVAKYHPRFGLESEQTSRVAH